MEHLTLLDYLALYAQRAPEQKLLLKLILSSRLVFLPLNSNIQ